MQPRQRGINRTPDAGKLLPAQAKDESQTQDKEADHEIPDSHDGRFATTTKRNLSGNAKGYFPTYNGQQTTTHSQSARSVLW